MEVSGEGPAMAEVTHRLRARFPDVGAEVIDSMVTELHREFDGDPIRAFVPVLVERQAADRLGPGATHRRRRLPV